MTLAEGLSLAIGFLALEGTVIAVYVGLSNKVEGQGEKIKALRHDVERHEAHLFPVPSLSVKAGR